MKQILVDLDERSLRELERVAPVRKRKRAEFIRLAIRRALDVALDLDTAAAYGEKPLLSDFNAGDLEGWDPENELARPAKGKAPKRTVKRTRS